MQPAAGTAAAHRRALECLVGVPATDGNHVEVLRNGDQIFPAMFDAVGAANSAIDFLTFVYWSATSGASSPRPWPSGQKRACGCECCSTPWVPTGWTGA